ncbi:hypothetical protein [Ruminococcus sp.]|uniref:hypothetical protein n=1 Tax=Ruminococcus sp. TaxID=41978 RepID=UPI003AB8A063
MCKNIDKKVFENYTFVDDDKVVYCIQNKGQEVIKMGKTILTTILIAVLDCAIAAVKELGD